MLRPAAKATAIVLGVLIGCQTLAMAGSQRDSLAPLAKDLLKLVTDTNQSGLEIVVFTGEGHSNIGAGLREDLKLALHALRPGLVQEKAALRVTGTYKRVPDPLAPDLVLLKVDAAVEDKSQEIASYSIQVRDTGLIALSDGGTVSLAPKATREMRNKALQPALQQPSYHVQNTIIRTRPQSPFGLEVLVTSRQHAPTDVAGWNRIPPRAPINQNGEAYVAINRDEVYALRVHNKMKHEAAVTTTIDGVDVFTFSEIRDEHGLPRYKQNIIAPGTGMIVGWHKTNQRSDSFLVTEYGKGAASKVGIPAQGKVGVITVRFALAWQGKNIPEEEMGARDGGNETGFGPPVRVNQQEVQRHTGVVRDVISVRYSR